MHLFVDFKAAFDKVDTENVSVYEKEKERGMEREREREERESERERGGGRVRVRERERERISKWLVWKIEEIYTKTKNKVKVGEKEGEWFETTK
jgi:hypothetical protein